MDERNAPLGLYRFAHALAGLDSYVLIGGMACSILMENAGLNFRSTKDFDVVLLADGDNARVTAAIWKLVREGGYRIRNGREGHPIFYRFDKPTSAGFPSMIELFSRSPDFTLADPLTRIVPVSTDDDVSSLSAIVLDDEYYSFLVSGVQSIPLEGSDVGIRVLEADRLIAFKAKAFLDLDARRKQGEEIDEKKVKKHRNDVFRLLHLIVPGVTLDAPVKIIDDVSSFLDRMNREDFTFLEQTSEGITKEEALSLLRSLYRVTQV